MLREDREQIPRPYIGTKEFSQVKNKGGKNGEGGKKSTAGGP